MGKTKRIVRIQWTQTAVECLKALPKDVQRGLMSKADELYTCSDPRQAHKPLTGLLRTFYRITYGRYRAIYCVNESTKANGEVVIVVTISFVAAGIRREHSRDDVYRVAQKLVELGLIDVPTVQGASPSTSPAASSPPSPRRKRKPKR